MGATTPKYAFPYPVGTDRVMDGDNAIQALAERVEAVMQTAYTAYTPTLYNGHVAGPGALVARYRLMGPTLHLRISYNVSTGAILPSQIQFGLPPGMQMAGAAGTVHVPLRAYTSGTSQYLGMATNGVAADRLACYIDNNQTVGLNVLGVSFLANGSNLDINGTLELSTGFARLGQEIVEAIEDQMPSVTPLPGEPDQPATPKG
jgi:hypothetical protein